jgi:toxin ParE1/3/4
MGFKVIWTEQAREDLRNIVAFIALDDPLVAERYGLSLISKVDTLINFPRLGRVVPEIGLEDIREIIVRPYRIVYQVDERQQVIAIARVWHAARGEPELPS